MDKIIFQNVHKKYKTDIILENANLEIEKKKITFLVAPNGSGKTTTINLLCKFMYPDNGSIILPDRITEKDISVVFGGDKNLLMKNTIEENIK